MSCHARAVHTAARVLAKLEAELAKLPTVSSSVLDFKGLLAHAFRMYCRGQYRRLRGVLSFVRLLKRQPQTTADGALQAFENNVDGAVRDEKAEEAAFEASLQKYVSQLHKEISETTKARKAKCDARDANKKSRVLSWLFGAGGSAVGGAAGTAAARTATGVASRAGYAALVAEGAGAATGLVVFVAVGYLAHHCYKRYEDHVSSAFADEIAALDAVLDGLLAELACVTTMKRSDAADAGTALEAAVRNVRDAGEGTKGLAQDVRRTMLDEAFDDFLDVMQPLADELSKQGA